MRATTLVTKTFITILLVCLTQITTSCASMSAPASGVITPEQREDVLNGVRDTLSKRAFAWKVDFELWDDHLTEHQEAVDAAISSHDFALAVNEVLEEFEVSHLKLWTPDGYQLNQRGIRINPGFDGVVTDDGLLVTYVFEQGAAWLAGIRTGDIVTQIDGKPMTRKGLAAEAGVSRLFEFHEPHEQTRREWITFGEHPAAPSCRLYWLDSEVAVLQVTSFKPAIYKKSEIDDLIQKALGARTLIVDVRGNLGGRLSSVRHLLGWFLPKTEPAFRWVDRRHWDEYQNDGAMTDFLRDEGITMHPGPGRETRFEGDVVVLVDWLSGSGGEAFAVALQKAGRGIVIGARTRGGLVASRTFRLPHGFAIQIPFAELLTADGERIEGVGVSPDIELSDRDTLDDKTLMRLAIDRATQEPTRAAQADSTESLLVAPTFQPHPGMSVPIPGWITRGGPGGWLAKYLSNEIPQLTRAESH